MDGTSKTSIIIVTYNALDFVRGCIESIVRNTSDQHEIIVVDNASREDTRDYLRGAAATYKTIRLILNEENALWSPGNNIGLRAMSGDSRFALLLNSDTMVLGPHWLEKLQAPFRGSNHIGVTGIQHNFQPVSPMYGAIDGCCLMFPTSLLRTVGYLDESYPWNGAGFILNARAWAMGYKYYHVTDDDVLIHYGKRSRFANRIQLSNQPVDTTQIMKDLGLRPHWDPVAFIRHRLGWFDVNDWIGVSPARPSPASEPGPRS